MKKVDFYITEFGVAEKVSGYSEVFEPAWHTSVELGFYKRRNGKWAIVQMMSGTVIRKDFATRKEAVAAVTFDMLLKLAEAMNREKYIKSVAAYRERISRAEEKPTVQENPCEKQGGKKVQYG